MRFETANGTEAEVSDEDADLLDGDWVVKKNRGGPQCVARRPVTMHRVIMERILGRRLSAEECVDHIDRNPLNNCRTNLRVCTKAENSRNRRVRHDSASGLKGVYKYHNRYKSVIRHDRKQYYIGTFASAEDAALAYDAKARELHGEFASTNFPEHIT